MESGAFLHEHSFGAVSSKNEMFRLSVMEEVLAVYERPYNLKHPVVCVDECKTELHSDLCGKLPVEAGQGKREDYEYV